MDTLALEHARRNLELLIDMKDRKWDAFINGSAEYQREREAKALEYAIKLAQADIERTPKVVDQQELSGSVVAPAVSASAG